MKVTRIVALFLVALPLAAQQPKPPVAPKVSVPVAPKAAPVATPALPTAEQPLDINTATRAQLEALPGIGAAYAERIIKARPFQRKDQIKALLPAGVYEKVQALIIAKQLTK